MEERLKKNICNLDDYAVLSDVKDLSTQQRAHIGDDLEYACRFWTTHLMRTTGSSLGIEEVQRAIDRFFTTYFLFWIEVLSLLGNLEVAVHALSDIQQWYTLVSYIWSTYRDLCLYLSRQEISANGHMMVSDFSWNPLT